MTNSEIGWDYDDPTKSHHPSNPCVLVASPRAASRTKAPRIFFEACRRSADYSKSGSTVPAVQLFDDGGQLREVAGDLQPIDRNGLRDLCCSLE